MLCLTKNTGKLTYWFLLCMMLPGLTACSTWGFMDKYPRHSFSFDARHDSPDAEVLDYEYGTTRQEGTHANKERIALGHVFFGENSSGHMLRGDFLSVKWRIKNPAKPWEYLGYYEDKVDLRKRLPADMTGLRVHFVIKGSQLYVYLISKELKPASEPAGPVQKYDLQKQTQIYPDQPHSSNK